MFGAQKSFDKFINLLLGVSCIPTPNRYCLLRLNWFKIIFKIIILDVFLKLFENQDGNSKLKNKKTWKKKNSCKESCYSSGSNCYGTKTHEKTCSFLWYIHKLSSSKMYKIHIYTHTHWGFSKDTEENFI